MVLVGAIAVAFLVLGAGLSLVLSRSSGGPQVLGVMTAVAAGGAGIWTAFALTAKRVRDTGLAPLPVIVGATLLFTFDYYILTRFTDVRFFSPFAGYTPLGGLLATGWFAFLVCWPGRRLPARLGHARQHHARRRHRHRAVCGLCRRRLSHSLELFCRGAARIGAAALASGWPSVSAAVLSPLAELQDARAENNLAVLRARGVGTAQDFADARRLFARAADNGSVRARLNSIMIAKGACRQDLSHATDVAAALAPIAALDWAAAGHIQDCLYFEATARILPDRISAPSQRARRCSSPATAVSCCIPDRPCSIVHGQCRDLSRTISTSGGGMTRLSGRGRARRWNCCSRRPRPASPAPTNRSAFLPSGSVKY